MKNYITFFLASKALTNCDPPESIPLTILLENNRSKEY